MKKDEKIIRFFALRHSEGFSPKNLLLRMTKRIAFTLAEVLIVLGIIGVVAALTIPTLMKNYQKQITLTRVKNTYSLLSQALKLSEIDHGDVSQWDIPDVSSPYAESNAAISEAFADEYLMKYIKGAKKYKLTSTSSTAYKGVAWYRLQNGIVSIYIWPRGIVSEVGIYTTSDVKVGKLGRNRFVLILTKTGWNGIHGKVSTGGIYFYGYGWDRNKLKNDSGYGCNNKNATYYGIYCGALIQTDGWKMSDDYEWR